MKTCECGQPIYDEPDNRYDKCYCCMVKSFKEAVDKRLFSGSRIYDEPKDNPVGYVEDF